MQKNFTHGDRKSGWSSLSIWTVYDHPKDFPHSCVARRFLLDQPTDDLMVAPSLDELRTMLAHFGLYRLARHPSDDPVIVETWL